MDTIQQIPVGAEEDGCRTDRIVRKRLSLMPLSSIYLLFRKGKVLVNGKKAKQDYRLKTGDVLEVGVDAAEITRPPASSGKAPASLVKTSFFRKNFTVIYEDAHLMACNKPTGLVVHPGSGHTRGDSLIELAAAYLDDSGKAVRGEEIALVHRLDRDTSGVILIAKNKRTLRLLHDQFKERSLTKEYRAVCHNRPPEYEGTVRLQLSRTDDRNNGMKMRVGMGGQQSVSRYRVDTYNGGISQLTIFLETGKTHQIRVHLAHIGAPIAGDVRYGDQAADKRVFGGRPPRLYLHAHRISFKHPHTRKNITIKAPVPEDFARLFSHR